MLEEVLNQPKNTVKYLSPEIQNEIITILGTHCKETLVAKIRAAPHYTLVLDSTQDVAKVRVASIISRPIRITHLNGTAMITFIVHTFIYVQDFYTFLDKT